MKRRQNSFSKRFCSDLLIVIVDQFYIEILSLIMFFLIMKPEWNSAISEWAKLSRSLNLSKNNVVLLHILLLKSSLMMDTQVLVQISGPLELYSTLWFKVQFLIKPRTWMIFSNLLKQQSMNFQFWSHKIVRIS